MRWIPEAIGGPGDHAHVLVGLKATHMLAEVVRQMKWGIPPGCDCCETHNQKDTFPPRNML